MIKKTIWIFFVCIVLASSGCKSNKNFEKGNTHSTEDFEEKTKRESQTETIEDVQQFFYSITEEMLNACDTQPSSESYWNDSLVFLNQFNQDVRLYGMSVGEKTAMLLYVEGEKVLIEYPFPTFRNFYEESPGLNVYDIDDDEADEVIISLRTFTGSIRKYAMWVCDYEDKWNVYMYEDYMEDIEKTIKYNYDDKNNTIMFLGVNGNVLWKEKLPEWTKDYPYTGIINFENNMGFDAETIQMDVVPQVELKDSLPYEPIRIIFDIGFVNGDFGIVSYNVQKVDLQN